jgi:putative ABC transport system substrate-binding protein
VTDAPTAIIAVAPAASLAAKAATATIPIVFAIGADPVDLGLVSSLNRPSGNVTGVNFFINTLGAKRLELLRELVPSAAVVGFLVNPTNPTSESQIADVRAAVRSSGVDLLILNAGSERDIDAAFASFLQQRVNAIIIGADSEVGGLISYGASITDAYRLAGGYAGRILRGEKPADLPVQQTVKFELTINLKTAKTLGLTVPLIMQMTADEVIE